jgi:3alpha(or 20beta)-hydroxysteroid dehydrogenase
MTGLTSSAARSPHGAAFHGKVVVITGAARGQGAREAELFAQAGANVVITDVLDELGEKLAASLVGDVTFVHHDVTQPEDWARVISVTQETFGRMDVLVNNAGIYLPAAIEQTSYESMMRQIQVNQVGVFLGMQSAIAPLRAAGGGAIVNISSGAGLEGVPGIAAYSATKWAVRGLTRCAAKELAADGIRVNSVHPGLIDTAMLEDNSPEMMDMYRAMIPLKRLGVTDDIAHAVVFLASPAAGYITGAELAIDGGVSA